MALVPGFKYKVLVSADTSLIGKLFNEAQKCAERQKCVLEVMSEGALFSFAEALPATLLSSTAKSTMPISSWRNGRRNKACHFGYDNVCITTFSCDASGGRCTGTCALDAHASQTNR